ncbi:ACR175Wp [Eremothecium gossypii ATCC 10895]|uniref:Sulfhydryl oxidase n=1 Tax=Eremothecium gossypii (strain ATCC 10895 / CBS 109.51 / FGSC 9923 / NRRL Y-1056) TaxID=284811 RepID=Q75BU6_EREGS|nr:ACR175Wp [Eremothecium gossypii ATCC 10895]AAS51401.1 ACR175Wp [Eremothecium gossypii ATCC 10895]AEY95692.1 FACR175Wp [Eremothecium gossypii FDAG1]
MKLHRQKVLSIVAAAAIVGLWYMFFGQQLSNRETYDPDVVPQQEGRTPAAVRAAADKNQAPMIKGSIMPGMPDPTAKQELGRATWKLFHTMLARFPDEPSEQEREKLHTFLHLLAELYPCGECSVHFVSWLKKLPPQTSSRSAAATWGCSIHNKVNLYLGKPAYDCSKILEDYDCGCGDDAAAGSLKVSVHTERPQGG